jgi:hypothetical protein
MRRLTITLSDARCRALKDAAARRGKTVDALIEESLEIYGIKCATNARALVQRARNHAGLSATEASELAARAVKATRKH